MKPIRSDKIRNSAEMEECTLRIITVCNFDARTTIFAHFPDESHGIGRKSDDLCGGYACSTCHDAIDGRDAKAWATVLEDREWYMRRAMVRTWRRMVETGIIKIAGYEP